MPHELTSKDIANLRMMVLKQHPNMKFKSGQYGGSNGDVYYHIVVDTNIDMVTQGYNENDAILVGQMNESVHGAMPVFLSKDDAERCAKRMLEYASKNGYVGNGKHFPVFGVVIVGYKFREDIIPNITKNKILMDKNNGKRTYEVLNEQIDNVDVVTYIIPNNEGGEVERGVINKNSYIKLEVAEAKYVKIGEQMQQHCGFALLNIAHVSTDGIKLLKALCNSDDWFNPNSQA